MRKQIEFFVAGAETTRYHTVRTIQTETVGHHSHGVAMFCVLLGGSPKTVRAALVHDLAEHQLGDIPAPAKKQYGIGTVVNDLEDQLLRDVRLNQDLTKEEARTLKLADIFQGMVFCIREMQMGNKSMEVVLRRYSSYAEDHVLVEKERVIFDILEGMYHDCK